MLIAITSVKGAPGATRLAMSLTALWPGDLPATYLECDSTGGTIANRYHLPTAPSLTTLAAAGFHETALGLVEDHVQVLPGGLPVVVAPSEPFGTAAAIADMARADGFLQQVQADTARVVLADCGRLNLRHQSPVLRLCDAIAVAAFATPEHLGLLGPAIEQFRSMGTRIILVLRGSGYSSGEVERALGVRTFIVPEASDTGLFSGRRRNAYTRSIMTIAHHMEALALHLLPEPAM